MQFDTEEFTERINEIPRRMMTMQTQESNWVFVVSLGTSKPEDCPEALINQGFRA